MIATTIINYHFFYQLLSIIISFYVLELSFN